jgi:hypothetical protein
MDGSAVVTGYILSTEMMVSMERAQDRRIQELISKALELCEQNGVMRQSHFLISNPFLLPFDELSHRLKLELISHHSHGVMCRSDSCFKSFPPSLNLMN